MLVIVKSSSIQEDQSFQHFPNKTKPKMLALSPPLFSTSNCWTLEDLISHQFHPQNKYTNTNINISKETETSDSLLPSPSSSGPQNNEEFMNMSKKHNHNAIERDRRKRVNNLYSSLRSLLPEADQKKKLSIPGTVSSVLKYIPELQKEVEGLVQKKEKLLSSISRQEELRLNKKRKCPVESSPLALSVSPLGDREVLIQISTIMVVDKNLLFEALEQLEEEEGVLLLNVSSFKSFGGRTFKSLHLQVQGNHKVDAEMLGEKLLSFYEKTQEQGFL